MSTMLRRIGRAGASATAPAREGREAPVTPIEVAPPAPTRLTCVIATWTLSRLSGLAVARARGLASTDLGPEFLLRVTLTEDGARRGSGAAHGTGRVRIELIDPVENAPAAITLATGEASLTLGQAGELAGLVVRDATGTLLDLTFAPDFGSSRGDDASRVDPARKLIFARTDLFARLGIEGGRYELA
jgi:hypothetical protein